MSADERNDRWADEDSDKVAAPHGMSSLGGEGSSILDQLQLFPLPVPPNVTPRPVTAEEKARIDTLSELQFFLATAPTRWNQSESTPMSNLCKFQLPNGEFVSCVLWNGLYHITGTDIVRALAFRFEAFGRPIKATKKWEEGVFSDLRNLKPGIDACLEEPKSPLLDFLFRNGCIRTQKKQKVFYWFSVPHDRLFLDALERDLKREKIAQVPTTEVVGEPARSFRYDPRRSLYEQFAGQNPGMNTSLTTPAPDYGSAASEATRASPAADAPTDQYAYGGGMSRESLSGDAAVGKTAASFRESPVEGPTVAFQRTLFEGSPAYKRRRVRSRQGTSPSVIEDGARRGSPGPQRGYTPQYRDQTASPKYQHQQLRKVSGGADREGSPLGTKRERSTSAMPEEGEKVYVCAVDFCRRPFKRLEHLKRHVRTHTQERPYECHKCTRTFSRQDNLVQHLRTHGRVEQQGLGGTPGPNPGLGIGTPPPREGVEYYVATAGPNNGVASYRWATASPAGENYPLASDPHMLPLPSYRSAGSMPPPSLPHSSRHSTVPPDWPSIAIESAFAPNPSPYTHATSSIRRFRSATPSGLSNLAVPVQMDQVPRWGGSLQHSNHSPALDLGHRHSSGNVYPPQPPHIITNGLSMSNHHATPPMTYPYYRSTTGDEIVGYPGQPGLHENGGMMHGSTSAPSTKTEYINVPVQAGMTNGHGQPGFENGEAYVHSATTE